MNHHALLTSIILAGLVFAPMHALSGADSASELLAGQRTRVLDLAPFRIEYTNTLATMVDPGKRPKKIQHGYCVFAKDGRFIIHEKSDGAKNDVNEFAWDGKSLYRSWEPSTMYFISKDHFPDYCDKTADAMIPDHVPVIDIMENLTAPVPGSPRAVSFDGSQIQVPALQIFAYLGLHDMYFSPVAGKYGPQWSDVSEKALVSTCVGLADRVVSSGKERLVIFTSKGKKTERGTSYFMQMSLAPRTTDAGAESYRVQRVTVRGPWNLVYNQTSPDFTVEDLLHDANSDGAMIDFTYTDEIGKGWLPAKIIERDFEGKEEARRDTTPAHIADDDTAISAGQLTYTDECDITRFEHLSDDEANALFDQFLMMQNRLQDATQLKGWQERHTSSAK